jgi:hypothetical protein
MILAHPTLTTSCQQHHSPARHAVPTDGFYVVREEIGKFRCEQLRQGLFEEFFNGVSQNAGGGGIDRQESTFEIVRADEVLGFFKKLREKAMRMERVSVRATLVRCGSNDTLSRLRFGHYDSERKSYAGAKRGEGYDTPVSARSLQFKLGLAL